MYSWIHIQPEAYQKIQILTNRKQLHGSSSKEREELFDKSMTSHKKITQKICKLFKVTRYVFKGKYYYTWDGNPWMSITGGLSTLPDSTQNHLRKNKIINTLKLKKILTTQVCVLPKKIFWSLRASSHC